MIINQEMLLFSTYSRVHISSDTAFLKILKKPSIVQFLTLRPGGHQEVAKKL